MAAIPFNKVEQGYYIAHRPDVPDSEFVVVVWGAYPFMQAYTLPTELGDRPNFTDAKLQNLEFLVRLPDAKALAAELGVEVPTPVEDTEPQEA